MMNEVSLKPYGKNEKMLWNNMEALGFESRNVIYIFKELFHISPKIIKPSSRSSVS